jgi:ribose transport system substrate-binding protein
MNKSRLPKMTSQVLRGIAVASTIAATSLVALGTVTSVASAAPKITVAFSVGDTGDPFFQTMYLGAQAEATKLGVNLDFQGNPATYSPATQLPYLDQILAQKPSALVVAPTDTKALESVIGEFVKDKIPVLNVDSGDASQSNIVSWITGNNLQGGEQAATGLATAMGYKSSGYYNIVIGVSSLTTSTDAARLLGFKTEIAKSYPKMHVLDVFQSQSISATSTSDFNDVLASHPGKPGTKGGVSGIFAIDGTNATGAAAALAGHRLVGTVKLIGYDAYATNVAQIYNAKSNKTGAFTALIAQQPFLEGQLAVQYAVQAAKGSKKGIPHLDTIPNILLTGSSSKATLTKYTYQAS